MNRYLSLFGLLLLVGAGGCSLPSALFSVFGNHYTGGGTTLADKESHFDRQFESTKVDVPWDE